MVKKGIFVLVIFVFYFSFFPCNSYAIKSTTTLKFPNINARYALILDRNSKTVLYGKKENEICKMASTTKIMTAIVVIENANLKDTVIVSSKAARTGGSRLGLSTGSTLTVENLLYGLMMRSRK